MGPRPLPPGGRERAREEGPRLPEPPGSHARKADLHQAVAAGGGGGKVAWPGRPVHLTVATPLPGTAGVPPAANSAFAFIFSWPEGRRDAGGPRAWLRQGTTCFPGSLDSESDVS